MKKFDKLYFVIIAFVFSGCTFFNEVKTLKPEKVDWMIVEVSELSMKNKYGQRLPIFIQRKDGSMSVAYRIQFNNSASSKNCCRIIDVMQLKKILKNFKVECPHGLTGKNLILKTSNIDTALKKFQGD